MSTPNTAVLADLRDISIDRSLPVETKICEFIRQVVNPYHYMVNDVTITASFAPNAPPLEDGFRRLRA